MGQSSLVRRRSGEEVDDSWRTNLNLSPDEMRWNVVSLLRAERAARAEEEAQPVNCGQQDKSSETAQQLMCVCTSEQRVERTEWVMAREG